MDLSFFIAKRYIFTKRNFQFISVITFLSLIGIAIGVAALIIVLSIFNGFQELTKQQFIGFDPHLRILPKNADWINLDSINISKIKNISGVNIVTSNISSKSIITKNQALQTVSINSIDEKYSEFYSGIKNSIILGKWQLSNDNSMPGIILGTSLAANLNAYPGDTVTLFSSSEIEQFLTRFHVNSGYSLIVTGIFASNIKDYDFTMAFITNNSAHLLFNPPVNSVTSIDIKVNNINNILLIKNHLESTLNKVLKVITWQDLNPDLFYIMRFERFSTFAVLSIIVILAVFNVLISLSMTVIEKHRDIGILKSMGAETKTIYKIYLFEGLLIGSIGTFFGTAIGLAFCYGQINYKWFKIDTSKYIIDSIPMNIQFFDIVFIICFALFLSGLAAIYPAYRAGNTLIIDSIRSE
jgi:lipoprotein-releasing system permease protein